MIYLLFSMFPHSMDKLYLLELSLHLFRDSIKLSLLFSDNVGYLSISEGSVFQVF